MNECAFCEEPTRAAFCSMDCAVHYGDQFRDRAYTLEAERDELRARMAAATALAESWVVSGWERPVVRFFCPKCGGETATPGGTRITDVGFVSCDGNGHHTLHGCWSEGETAGVRYPTPNEGGAIDG